MEIKNNEESVRLILVQAPADVLYALQLMELYKTSRLILYVLNVHNVYKMLQILNLKDCEIFFIPYPDFNLRSFRKILNTKRVLSNIWDTHFSHLCKKVDCLHFFSRYEDPLASFIITKFIKMNSELRVFYNNHYDPQHVSPSFLGLIKSLFNNFIMHFITGAKYELVDVKYPEFKIRTYKRIDGHPMQFSTDVVKKYKIKFSESKSVLFLLNPLFANSDKDEICLDIISKIVIEFKKRGYITYVKGHPRMGCSEEYRGLMDKELECYILSELIDYDSFEYVIGADSTAVAHAALERKSKTYSILDMIHCYNYDLVKTHLLEQSKGYLDFITNIDKLFE